MIQVTKERFNKFLLNKEYEVRPGIWIHSLVYFCKNTGKQLAYLETSSWGAPDVYMIDSDVHEDNLAALDFITNTFLK